MTERTSSDSPVSSVSPGSPMSRVPRRAPRTPFALLVGGLVVGGMCALLALNTASAANELQRHDFATKDAGVAAQVQQLQNEIQASAAPGNLAAVAGALGMVPAGNPAFLRVEPDGRVRVLGSPLPATVPPVVAPPTPPKPTPTPTPSKTTTKNKTKKKPVVKPTTPTPTPTPTTTLPGGTR